MEEFPTLKNPPITEAIIELRFSPPATFDILESISNLLKGDFPNKKTVSHHQVFFQVEGEKHKSQSKDLGLDHLRLLSENARKSITLKRGRFAFSFTGHYSNFDEFSDQAIKV